MKTVIPYWLLEFLRLKASNDFNDLNDLSN